jgi:hypothetical protein
MFDRAPSAVANDLPDALLRGGNAIAAFLFPGDPHGRRKVHHYANTGKLPVFRVGAILYGRKSQLTAALSATPKKLAPGRRRAMPGFPYGQGATPWP